MGSTRGVRTKGTSAPLSLLDRLVDRPFGTGFDSRSPIMTRKEKNPDNDDRRRLMVLAMRPDPPSERRTTLPSNSG